MFSDNDTPASVVWKLCSSFVLCLLLGSCFVFCLGVAGCLTKTTEVALREVAPDTLLHRYEWFKDVAATLDARKASIQVYERRFQRLKEAYNGKSRSDWSRADQEQSNLWEQEVAGIRASFNSLAAEYNSAMSKINWRYCNQGDLPKGADVPLPREFKIYESN